jgi:biotin carboxyl carrier protein
MPYHIKIKDRVAKIEILDQKDTLYKVKIGEKEYQLDVVKVENGVYSVIYNGKSTNMEMIEAETPNKYIVNTRSSDYNIEIIDAKARYKAFGKGSLDTTETIIRSPMPGKIVNIPVKIGDMVSKGRYRDCCFCHENGKRIQIAC